jgi:hypothetical protein
MGDAFYGFDLAQRKTLESLGVVPGNDNLAFQIAQLQSAVSNLNSWAATLANKLNADFTAQNALAAFPLTLDVNYDSSPQA